jgi:hypothetical protein
MAVNSELQLSKRIRSLIEQKDLSLARFAVDASGNVTGLLGPNDEPIELEGQRQGLPITSIDTVTVGVDYPTLQAAIIDLSGKNRRKKIRLPAGINTENHVYLSAYDTSNLFIEGAATLTLSIISVQSCTQVSGYSHNIVLNVSAETIGNCAVDDIIAIRSTTGGTNNEQLLGTHKITNVDTGTNRITVRSNVKPAFKPGGSITSTALVYKTKIQEPLDSSGFLGLHNIAMLDRLVIGPGCSFGIGSSNLKLCFYGPDAYFDAANGSHIEMDNLTFGAVETTAFGATYNARGHCDGIVVGNYNYAGPAIVCYGGSFFSMWNIRVVNADVGLHATDLARVQATNSKFYDCTTAGILADTCSQVTTPGCTYTRCGANTVPAVGVLSTDGAFISA